MENIINNFYEGFEGEVEIQFVQISNNGDKNIISIWNGYFDDIMAKVEPRFGEWTGLAHFYHSTENFLETEDWEIADKNLAYEQLKELEKNDFKFEETKEVLKSLCTLLAEAIEKGYIVKIKED